MRRLIPFLLSAALLATPLGARAQSSDKRSAQEIYREATQHIEKKEWKQARPLLLELWASKRTHDVAASLGQVEYQLGNYPSSAWYLAFAIHNLPPREKEELEERYQLAFDTVKLRVATVKITLAPAEAELYVDGMKAERGPQGEVYVRPGNHSFEALYQGRSGLKTLVVGAGETHQIEVAIGEEGSAAGSQASEKATAPAATEPEATPSEPAPASALPHERSMIPAYVAGGIAVVGLGIGIGFELAAQSADSDIERLHDAIPPGGCAGPMPAAECGELKDAAESFDTRRTIAVTGFVIAGVGAAAAAAYLLWPQEKPSAGASRPLQFGAALDPTGGAIFARGSF